MKIGLGLGLFPNTSPAAEAVFDPYSQGFFSYFWNWNVDNNEERVFQDNGSTLVNDTEQPVQLWRERINNGELGLASETAPQSDSNGAIWSFDSTLRNLDGLTHDSSQNFFIMWRATIIGDDVVSTFFTFVYQGSEVQENTYQVYYDYLTPWLVAYVGNETSITLASPPIGQPLYFYFQRITSGEDMTHTLGYSADFGETWQTASQVIGPGMESDVGCYVGLTANYADYKLSSLGYGYPTDGAAATAQRDGVAAYWHGLYDLGG